MTYEPDIERVLERWFGEGPARMPDGFLDRMVGRIDRAPQARLPRLRRQAIVFTHNLNGRLVAASFAMVVFVAVIGGTVLSHLPAVGVLPSSSPSVLPSASPSTGPSPSAQAIVDPAQLQATWSSVGTRPLPYHADRDGSVDLPAEIVIGPGTMKVVAIGDDWLSSLAFVGSDRFEITSQTGPNTMYAKCNIGDLGTYRLSLSATGSRLTLTPVGDACPSRAAVLAGDWDHTPLGPLAPGRHEATPFKPFDRGIGGTLAYSVPAGWQDLGEDRNALGLSGPDSALPTTLSVYWDVVPSTADTSCDSPAAADVGRTPGEVAAWLATLPNLVVTKPTQVTIGGLDGVMIDVSVTGTWTKPCTTPPEPGTDVATFVDAEWGGLSLAVGGETHVRYILLDRGDGQSLLIDIEASDEATWSTFLAAAMRVVNSFEFTR